MPILSRLVRAAPKLVPPDFPNQMIFQVQERKASAPSHNDLLHEYADVIVEHVSLIEGETFTIKLKEDARPFCCANVVASRRLCK